MIKIRRLKSSKKGGKSASHYELFIDNVLIKNIEVTASGQKTDYGLWFGVRTQDREVFAQLGSYTFNELPKDLCELVLESPLDWAEFIRRTSIPGSYSDSDDSDIDVIDVEFWFHPGPENWRKPYFARAYFQELSTIVKSGKHQNVEVELMDPEEDLNEGFRVAISGFFANLPINVELRRCSEILRQLHNNVERNISQLAHNSILMYFDFPNEIKTSCEQYLLYFIDFLRDMGVDATSQLGDAAGQVLFSVTPSDPKQALDKIRVALEIYLRLPASPIADVTSSDTAIRRLAANIHRLKSDLLLAHALLEAKQTTIEAQQIQISQLRSFASGAILVESTNDVLPRPSAQEKESLLGGIFAITPYDGKGFSINLPEIFRKLRKLLSED